MIGIDVEVIPLSIGFPAAFPAGEKNPKRA
jgi:hypothetical protein